MSFLSDIGNAFTSAVSTVANIASTVAPFMFPQATLALTAVNLLSSAIGGGVNQAASQLCKEAGMPKFLQDMIGQVVKEVLSQVTKQSDADCDKHVNEQCGHDFRDLQDSIGKSIADAVKNLRKGGDDDSADSWLVAIAKAMGKVAGQHAKKLAELSNKLDSLQGNNPDNAQESQKITNQMQGESQMLSLLQNAFSNVLKTIGESTSTMARKG